MEIANVVLLLIGCCLFSSLLSSLIFFGYLKIKVLIPISQRISRIRKKMFSNSQKRVERNISIEKEKLKIEIENDIKEYQKEIDELEKHTLEEAQQFFETSKIKIEEAYNSLIDRNTLYFNCSCDEHHKIPCLIDFTQEENKFVCPRCNNVWVVKITATPVLRGYNTGSPDIRHLESLKEREPFIGRENLGGEI